MSVVELSDDFVERVRRLKRPAAVARKAMQALKEAEREERREARLRAVQDAWAALDPDLRRRYLEAMGRFPYPLVRPLEPGADVLEDLFDRLKQMNEDPNAAHAPWADREARRIQERRRQRQRQVEHEELRQRLAAAELPYRPELMYPTDDDDGST
jgi:hypothetical protein